MVSLIKVRARRARARGASGARAVTDSAPLGRGLCDCLRASCIERLTCMTPTRPRAWAREQEKQLAWQAVKKATGGNTAWAGNPAGTVAMFTLSVSFGFFILTKGMTDLSLGLNKFR